MSHLKIRNTSNADLAVDAQAFGDVSAHAEHLYRRAILQDHRDQRFEPALLDIARREVAIEIEAALTD